VQASLEREQGQSVDLGNWSSAPSQCPDTELAGDGS